MDTLTIKATTKSLPVILEAEDGTPTHYTLKEMPASSRDKHFDAVKKRMEFGSDGKPTGVKNHEGLQAELICKCLFNGDGKLVDMPTVQSWPSSVVQSLYEAAQELNAFNKNAKELLDESKKE